jgi:hypothetical protein
MSMAFSMFRGEEHSMIKRVIVKKSQADNNRLATRVSFGVAVGWFVGWLVSWFTSAWFEKTSLGKEPTFERVERSAGLVDGSKNNC